MFPISDHNPRLRWPVITALLIVANVAVWVLLQGFGAPRPLAASLCHWALIPGDLLGRLPAGLHIPVSNNLACMIDGSSNPGTLLSSMFMHGGWLHIIGNMWFLWVFGDNVEDAMGRIRYALFYLLSGLGAAAAQIATDPSSAVPMVGASGAIGGVMGAYARCYPRARIDTVIFLGIIVTKVQVPAMVMLGYWFLLQLLGGLPSIGGGGAGGGVAFWAHIGGFATGLALSYLLLPPAALSDYRRRLQGDRSWSSRRF